MYLCRAAGLSFCSPPSPNDVKGEHRMTSIFRGSRPDLTPAQVVGVLVAGIPVIASLLRAFGVYDLSPDQQHALRDALVWCGVIAGALFACDAGLRAARNAADAKRAVGPSASTTPSAPVPATAPATAPVAAVVLGPESGGVERTGDDPMRPSRAGAESIAGS
jgi:hypothetical protein